MDIIVDIDGTLSDPAHRLDLIKGDEPQWDAFYDKASDDPALPVLCDLVQQLMGEGNRVIFFTGRTERIRSPTISWLCNALECEEHDLLVMMRRDGDHRKDDIIKNEMLQAIPNSGSSPSWRSKTVPASPRCIGSRVWSSCNATGDY